MPIYYVRRLSDKRRLDGPFRALEPALQSAQLWSAANEDVQVEDDTADGIIVKRIIHGKGVSRG